MTTELAIEQDFRAAVDRLMGLVDFERSTHSPDHWDFHLDRMRVLTRMLGNPQDRTPSVHVAGTKGKGSTSAMIASILAAAGKRTGLYTSPHLHSVVERIRVGKLIDGRVSLEPVSKAGFAASVDDIWPAVLKTEAEGGHGGVTFFEGMTAQAFHHFAKVGAGWQVIEVGLGGRLDSTNIITPEVSVITNISLDHVATLGDTIGKIAFEKAGIIKAGVPVVVAPQTTEAMTVVRQVAKERGAPLVDVAAIMTWQPESADHGGQSFRLTGANGEYSLRTPLLGDYQIENAATAVAAIETLNHNGAGISKEAIAQGIREVRWPARLQVLSTSGPLIVVDGAHNPYSVRRLVDTLPSLFEYDDVVLVFGALSGHSASGMLAELVRLSPRLVAVKSRHPRSADSATVADAARRFGIDVTFATNDVAEGTRHALKLVGPKTLLLAAGSLSVAAEVTEEIESIPAEVYPNLKPPPDIAKNPSV